EAELRASEERYRFLVENSPDVVFATDSEGRFTFMSETIERVIGRSPTEIVGDHFSTIVAQEALPYAAARWEALVADPFTLQTVRLKLIRADGGDPVPVEVSAIGIVDGDGRFAGIHGSTRDISERERLLAELRESEERHRVLVQSSPDLIFAIDPDGRYTFMSDRVEEMLGWRTDEVLGQHFGAFVDPAWFSEVEGQIDQLHARPGAPQTHQMVIRHKDGREIPYEVSAVAVVEPDGSLRAIHGVARDVGERVRLERELRESEERYRFLVENSPDIVYSTDGEGTFTYVSESIEKALGRKPGDLVGRHVSTIINYATPADIGRRWGVLREHPEHGITDRFELVHADGTIKPYEVSAVAITRDGVFTGVHGAARDIGERERLGAELRASEERYRYLVQSSPDLVWVTDEEGRFTFVSDTAASILGWEPAELIGKSFTELAPPDDGGRAVARFRWLAAKPTRVHRSQITIRTKDGRDILMDISGIGMVDDGRFVGAHGAARDVSDRERLERDLRRQAAELASSEERSHLARELHDSVTQALFSMTLLSRSIELLLQRDPAQVPEKLASLRDLQRDALAEMRALIFELRPGNVEEQGLITALRTHAAALAGRIGLPVIVEADLPERPPIDVEEALYRIAQEALHNIVKHAGARQVRVEVGRVAEGVRLRVTDDGRGFDPTKVPDGHLGLAGMRARAEKLGGHLDVRSTVGSGTAVEVVVPIGSPRPVGVTNGSH
ncbi:MAG: PAS domain S-box protein, partial [Chloroflexota bacterium]